MPLAPALENIIPADFNPATSRPEYKEREELWQLYLDLYELDQLKLKELVEKHADDEDGDKYKLRQALASVYNLVPTIINLSRNYLYSEAPTIDVKGDATLKAFVDNCNGAGTSLADWLKTQALPLSQVFGWMDAVVANPPGAAVEVRTQADARAANITPTVAAYTPLSRVNWSTKPAGGYNWARFRDFGDEGSDPFANTPPTSGEAYITLSAKSGDLKTAYWVRSVADKGKSWSHDGDLCPTARAPIASLFHQRSINPQAPHTGISKLAMMAVLTKQIIQILSWTTEDILANLAIFAIPSKDGLPPKIRVKDDNGNETETDVLQKLGSFSIIWYPKEGQPPVVVQGDTSHIEIKLKLVEMNLREVMRLANLMAVSGDAKISNSGVHSMVERNELFRELKDTAASLDSFCYELLALAKSWNSGKDVSAEEIRSLCVVSHFKGPYTMQPLNEVVDGAQKVIDLVAGLSNTAQEAMLKQVVRAAVTDEGLRDKAMKELEAAEMQAPVVTVPAGDVVDPVEDDQV